MACYYKRYIDLTGQKLHQTSQLMRLWYLSHRRPAKAQASLRIRAVSPEPSLVAHMKYGSRRRVRQKHLAHWMVAHARLLNEFTEDEKYHNFLWWLKQRTKERDQDTNLWRYPPKGEEEMSQLMRLWHFSSSVNSYFKRACAAIHWGYMSFWLDPSSTSILHMCEQRRLWQTAPTRRLAWAFAVAYVISTIISWAGSNCFVLKQSFI